MGNQQETSGTLVYAISMHSKRKGNVGQLAVAQRLAEMGFSVFLEAGDISKIDVIAEHKGRVITFQCKAVTPINGALHLALTKSGPGYQFSYTEGQFDFFAVYDLGNKQVYLVPSAVLSSHRKSMSLRLTEPKNGQHEGVNFAADYLPERILRDYTGNALPGNAEGDDIVQTTTAQAGQGNLE